MARVSERLVWASNWPHPSAPGGTPPDEVELMTTIVSWMGDTTTQQRILVDNPAALYNFNG